MALIGRELSEEGAQWRILAAVDGSLASERALEVKSYSLQIGEAVIALRIAFDSRTQS